MLLLLLHCSPNNNTHQQIQTGFAILLLEHPACVVRTQPCTLYVTNGALNSASAAAAAAELAGRREIWEYVESTLPQLLRFCAWAHAAAFHTPLSRTYVSYGL
jgi:hypothetical protein